MANPFSLRLAQPAKREIHLGNTTAIDSNIFVEAGVIRPFPRKSEWFQYKKTKSKQYTNYWKMIKNTNYPKHIIEVYKSVINYSIIVSQ